MDVNRIYHQDFLLGVKSVEDDLVSLTVTSPPYDNLRSYHSTSKWDFEIFKYLVHELRRVTKPGGMVVWVVGDGTVKGSETGTSFRQALYFMDMGFRLHDTMIYQKSGFNFPANNRYHQTFEYVFVFSKGKPKTFNPICDRKNKYVGQKAHGLHRGADENSYVDMSKIVKAKPVGEYGMRCNVWYVKVGGGHVTKDKFAYKHPAIFPESLAGDLIRSFSNEGDLVLDPMIGSGTTAKMCKILNRNFIGFENNEEYYKIACERVGQEI
jgi:site-specific DNA-methyltransferase (adenine-specific)